MTKEEREEAVKILIDMANALCLNPDTPQGMALKTAIKALKQEPCEDAISRQAVLDIIEDRIKNGLAQNVAISQYYHMEVEKLMPVNLQPKTGHWIYDKKSDLYICSNCGIECEHDRFGAIPTHYCPDCGIRMEEQA